MRKAVKKLTLCRETLVKMEAEHLRAAAGGTFATADNFTCGCETGTNCQVSHCICQ